MYERFTDRARKVMMLANRNSSSLGWAFTNPEHILAGIVEEGGGVGSSVLHNLGVNARAILSQFGASPTHEPLTLGESRLSQSAEFLVGHAVAESNNLGHNYIGTEHLLLALIQVESKVGTLLKQQTSYHVVLSEIKNILGVRKPEPSTMPGVTITNKTYSTVVVEGRIEPGGTLNLTLLPPKVEHLATPSSYDLPPEW